MMRNPQIAEFLMDSIKIFSNSGRILTDFCRLKFVLFGRWVTESFNLGADPGAERGSDASAN